MAKILKDLLFKCDIFFIICLAHVFVLSMVISGLIDNEVSYWIVALSGILLPVIIINKQLNNWYVGLVVLLKIFSHDLNSFYNV